MEARSMLKNARGSITTSIYSPCHYVVEGNRLNRYEHQLEATYMKILQCAYTNFSISSRGINEGGKRADLCGRVGGKP